MVYFILELAPTPPKFLYDKDTKKNIWNKMYFKASKDDIAAMFGEVWPHAVILKELEVMLGVYEKVMRANDEI